jgi:hemolysin III
MKYHNIISKDKLTESYKVELVNSIIHAAGILFGLIAVPLLIILTAKNKNSFNVMGMSIYGVSFLMTFTFSTLFHFFQQERKRNLFRLLDHLSIYFFIAGTYTAFVFNYLFNRRGIVLLALVWLFVVLGIIIKILFTNRFSYLTILFYLLIGWMFVFQYKAFFSSMPVMAINLTLTGAALYSLGVIFYVWEKWKYNHAIWHLFVLAASLCHFAAIFIAVR